MYKVSDEEILKNFLILPESEFNPFIMECAIYDASGGCIACTAPAREDSNDVIRLSNDTAKQMAKHFKTCFREQVMSAPKDNSSKFSKTAEIHEQLQLEIQN